jgi:hypothetical protein
MADELDELYQAPLAEFTALRTRLAAAAKKRGDSTAAEQLSAARKPTTSAWIVNRLVHSDPKVRERLSDLGRRLRAAHAAMDGNQIRELTAEQRRLVDGLSRAALHGAGIADPSAAQRDDITGTLQAAIADPDVAARIGRLTKAERWSGFGEFGDSTAVFTTPRPAGGTEPPVQEAHRPTAETPVKHDATAERAQREQRARAQAVLTAAKRAKSEADDALADRQGELAAARLRLDDARRRLADAEAAVGAAEEAHRDAKAASRAAMDSVKAAKAQLAGLPAPPGS